MFSDQYFLYYNTFHQLNDNSVCIYDCYNSAFKVYFQQKCMTTHIVSNICEMIVNFNN